MIKVLGLDIGIASVGHSIIELDEKEHTGEIIDLGVRIFTAAEHPKDGSSLALPRKKEKSTIRRFSKSTSN